MTTKLIRSFALMCGLAAGVALTSGDAKAQFGYPGYGGGSAGCERSEHRL